MNKVKKDKHIHFKTTQKTLDKDTLKESNSSLNFGIY